MEWIWGEKENYFILFLKEKDNSWQYKLMIQFWRALLRVDAQRKIKYIVVLQSLESNSILRSSVANIIVILRHKWWEIVGNV
jgi:hypothetical protein